MSVASCYAKAAAAAVCRDQPDELVLVTHASTQTRTRQTHTITQPFFEAGKAIGDKRATVAEKGFNRPFKRAIVSAGGLV